MTVKAYEVVYIFDSQLTDEQVGERIDRFHELLTAGGAGEVTTVDHWGRRQLTYPIKKRPNAYYVVAQFTSGPEPLPEFERALKLDEGLLRYLLVLHEGEPSAPMSLATRQPKRDDEDGEGEDEED
jgi:small subunit ribosomal protein S6